MIKNLRLLASLFVPILFSLTSSFAFAQATLTSDKPDYQPGDTLRLSGSGWQPGETVSFHFVETPVVCVTPHDRTTIADADGNIFFDQFYFNELHRVCHFS